MATNVLFSDENNNNFRSYLRTIHKYPMLSAEEEVHLATTWQQKNCSIALEKIVASHLRLVHKLALKYKGYGLPLNDLIAEGNVGIMQAVKNFDPSRGFRFSTYAMWWIRANMQEYILHSWSLVKIGTTAAQKRLFFNLRRDRNAIQGCSFAEFTDEHVQMIAEKHKVRADEVRAMDQRLRGQDFSLNGVSATDAESETEWQDFLVCESKNQEQILLEKDEISNRLNHLKLAMEKLSERESKILWDRRLSEEPLTLEEAGAKYGISRERVRQIEQRAFEKLQKSIKNSLVAAAA